MILPAVLIAALGLASCGGDDDNEETETPTTAEASADAVTNLDVKTVDFGFDFDTDAKLAAGAITLSQSNTGKEDHQVQVVKLNSGVKFDAFQAGAVKDAESYVVANASFVGGPIAGPGKSQSGIIQLDSGTYAFLCLIPSPSDNKAHVTKGMIAGPVEVVTSDSAADLSTAKADLTLTAKEFSYSTITSFSGKGTVELMNEGKQPHEAGLLSLQAGKTVADIGKFFSGPPSGPPPFAVAGGMAVIMPGTRARFDLDLAPGTYAFLCFVADPADQTPHFAKGMAAQFTVT